MHRFGLVVSAATLWLIASDVSAYCRLTTAEPSAGGGCSTAGRGLAWDRQCISYTVVQRARQDIPLDTIRSTIDESFAQWLAVDCESGPLPLDLRRTEQLGECTTAQYNQYGPNANTIMFLNTWEGDDFPPEAFGLTLVWHDPNSGEIFDADMQLNETIAPIAVCSGGCSRNVVDLANVVTHEAGHFLGLGHSTTVGTTMSANALLGETSKRTLEQDDRNGVCAIYGREPAAQCNAERGDFSPDRGFSPYCGDNDPDSSSCAARAPSPSDATWGAPAALALLGLLLAARRRGQRAKVLSSNATPSPINR